MSKRVSTSTRTSEASKKSKVGIPKNEDPATEYWNMNIAPIMKDAANEKEMETIAKGLFTELWTRSGKEVAMGAMKKYTGKVEEDVQTNRSLSGSWELSGEQGTLIIHEDISTAEFQARLALDYVDLHLVSTKGAHPLLYEGDCGGWDFYEDDIVVKVKVSFDSSNPDKVGVEINVPYLRVNRLSTGGEYSVIGTRK